MQVSAVMLDRDTPVHGLPPTKTEGAGMDATSGNGHSVPCSMRTSPPSAEAVMGLTPSRSVRLVTRTLASAAHVAGQVHMTRSSRPPERAMRFAVDSSTRSPSDWLHTSEVLNGREGASMPAASFTRVAHQGGTVR